ncbi:MAG: type II secretion system protein GspL [Steroidobacteraceae bacterium]|jgi:general secretion pathway protein L|nr:type II secretion system protein GspL [Steroidobacteraceae bacterium]
MADWFVVRLGKQSDDPVTWIAVDGEGRLLTPEGNGPLSQAATQATGRRVAVLVPAGDVLLTDAALPAKTGAKLAQVVPYALEEQVADDIDSLHFAVGRRTGATGRTAIAVVGRSAMQATLAALGEAGLAPAALHSEASLVAPNPGQVVAWLEGDVLVVCAPDRPPLVTPVTTLADAFGFLASTQAYGEGIEPATLSLLLHAPAHDWQQHAGELGFLQGHFATAKVQILPQGSLPWLASQIGPAAPLDLLQGEFVPRTTSGSDLRRWRLPAALAAAILLLFTGSKMFEIRRLNDAERKLDVEIEQTFRAAMPGALDSKDARQRMEKRYQSLQENGGQQGLLPALSAFATARAAAPDATLQGLSLREGALDLRVRATDAQSLDRINQELRARGFATEITSGTAADAGYEGRIQIKLVGV